MVSDIKHIIVLSKHEIKSLKNGKIVVMDPGDGNEINIMSKETYKSLFETRGGLDGKESCAE